MPRHLTAPGAATVVVSTIGVAVLRYFMPDGFDNAPGVSPGGIRHFALAIWGSPLPALTAGAFVSLFRLLILAVWSGYIALLIGALRDGQSRSRWAIPVVVCTPLALAFLFPPALSADVYAYAGWGRMRALHGWNPYTHTLSELAALGDPAAGFIPVPAPSNHGPVWNIAASGLVALLARAGLWWQVTALKALAGLALVIAALAARELTRVYQPRRAELTLLAVGLNPVLLIEGPGSGHNDIVMVALMLAGLAAHARGSSRAGYLLVGLSGGVKFISLAIVPWMMAGEVRAQPASRAGARATMALALALAPSVLGYAVFWQGWDTFHGIRAVYQQKTEPGGVRTDASVDGDAGSRPRWPVTLGVRLLILFFVHAGVTLLIWQRPLEGLHFAGWAWFALVLAWLVMPVTFSWYMVWPWSTVLIRWDRSNRPLLVATGVLSCALVWLYTVPYPG